MTLSVMKLIELNDTILKSLSSQEAFLEYCHSGQLCNATDWLSLLDIINLPSKAIFILKILSDQITCKWLMNI